MADLQLGANEILRTVADLPCPPGLPLLGNLFQMGPAKLHLTLEQWAKRFGSPFRVSARHNPNYSVDAGGTVPDCHARASAPLSSFCAN
jgi:hypothetical protein